MLDIEIDEDCFEMYNAMKNRKVKLINFRLSPDNSMIIVDPDSMKYSYMKKNVFETWAGDLPDDQCLYCLYDFDLLIGMDGMSSTRRNKIGFIVWAPPKSKIKDRMVLASAKDNLRRAIEGIQIEWQLNGRDDLEVDDFIKTLGQQPGIRHAGRIIGFEGESIKFWENWESHARDLRELHGTDRRHLDYYDKMKNQLHSEDTKQLDISRKQRSELSTDIPLDCNGVPQFTDQLTRSSSGNSSYNRFSRSNFNTSSQPSYNSNYSSNSLHRNNSVNNTANNSANVGTFSGGNKYGSSVAGSNGIGSNFITSSMQPKSSVVSYRDGVKVITEEYVVEDSNKKEKKKKKKKDKDKDSGLDAEEKRRKKEKKKAKKELKKQQKKLLEAGGTVTRDAQGNSSILQRIQRMNLN